MFVYHDSDSLIPEYAYDTSAPTGIDCAPENLVDVSKLAWVSTKDRLPEIAGEYLTTRIDARNGKPFLCVSQFDAEDGHFIETYSYEVYSYGRLMSWGGDEIDITNEILAWMPWPKLYSEEV